MTGTGIFISFHLFFYAIMIIGIYQILVGYFKIFPGHPIIFIPQTNIIIAQLYAYSHNHHFFVGTRPKCIERHVKIIIGICQIQMSYFYVLLINALLDTVLAYTRDMHVKLAPAHGPNLIFISVSNNKQLLMKKVG